MLNFMIDSIAVVPSRTVVGMNKILHIYLAWSL